MANREAEDYLRLISDDQVIISVNRNNYWANKQFPTINQAITFAAAENAQGKDVYVAVAKYGSLLTAAGNISRTKKNINSSRLYETDIDVGPDKPYATVQEAWDAFVAVRRALNLPMPNVVIMSGHGLRIQWIVDTPATPEGWKDTATKLSKVLTIAGLKWDTAVTTDITRAVRLPGFMNYKDPSAPVKAELLHIDAVISYAQFIAAIDATTPSIPGAARVSFEDAQLGSGNHISYTFERVVQGCPTLKRTLDTGGKDDDEPRWMKVLQFLACAQDGEKWIHEVSKGHPHYDEENTDTKFAQRFNADGSTKSGPILCSTFNAPECAACHHRGRISTPAALGLVHDNSSALPPGFFVNDKGTFIRSGSGEGAERISQIQFCDAYLYTQIDDRDNKPRDVLAVDITYATKQQWVYVPLTFLETPITLRRALLKENVVDKGVGKEVLWLMNSWVEKLKASNRYGTSISKIGWTSHDNKMGFALPEKVFWESPVERTRLNIDETLVTEYSRKGSFKTWQSCVQLFIDSSDPALVVIAMSAFAAPLMRFTSVNGGIMSLQSSDTGTGKTTAMQMGASVWGDPQALLMFSDDTVNSVMHKIATAPCMPVYWDEVVTEYSDNISEDMVKRIFRLAYGREKSRMSKDLNVSAASQWNTIMCTTSNLSLIDILKGHKEDIKPNMARLIEFTARPIQNVQDVSKLALISRNYGHAGRAYAEFLAQRASDLEALIPQVQSEAQNKIFTNQADTRFWSAMYACFSVATAIVEDMGLLRMPRNDMLKSIVDATTGETSSSGVHAHFDKDNHIDILMEFVTSHTANYMSWNFRNPKDPASGVVVLQEPKYGEETIIYNNVHTKKIQIYTKPFRKWITQRSHNTSYILNKIQNTAGCSIVRGILGKASPSPGGRKVYIELDVTKQPMIDSGFDELK